jgi:hypothetical protein
MDEFDGRSPHLRGLGFYDPDQHPSDKVTFIGVGGIGSFAALGAAKLGVPTITAYDDDVVDLHNYGNQLFRISNVEDDKVTALADMIGTNDARQFVGIPERATAETEYDGVVVSGVDSMEARAEIWKGVKFNPRVQLYLDGRIGGQIIVLYAVNPMEYDDVEAYEKTLHSDDEGVEAPCTERGVIDVGLAVGAAITQRLRMHFNGEKLDPITYINQETLSITKGGWVL